MNFRATCLEFMDKLSKNTNVLKKIHSSEKYNRWEETALLFLLADPRSLQPPADIKARLMLPDTPRLIMLGHSVMTASKRILSIEGRVVSPMDTSVSFAAVAFMVLFASYVFNMEYQEAGCMYSGACSEISHSDQAGVWGEVLRQRRGVGRRTWRKVTNINLHANTFIRFLMDFDKIHSSPHPSLARSLFFSLPQSP
ncbi:hypothetical protein SKAU_G00278910 [Synaphobranchus kaupii]|uniref:Uncharacterized protein n=1 Tax=Synaphobranchus kaupii TaxID=118154 RepID=A0A9Q1EWR6_SYNKA|nr:hypothetical protein SKAU_G00278910 [Synaphobranchus kaupii]